MAPVAVKAGVLLAVAAAGSTSVWYFSDSIFGSPLVSIADEKDQNQYDAKSLAKGYGSYFLSSKKNQKIWEKRFNDNKTKFADTENENNPNKSKDKFGTVKTAFSTDNNNTTALNKVCEEAYKLTTSANLVDTEPTDTESSEKFSAELIWKFCSLGSILAVADDETSYNATTLSSKIGGDTNRRKILVSAKKEENNWFWKIRDEEFKAESGERSKVKVTGTGANNSIKKLKDNDESIKTISEACHDVYSKDTNDDSSKTKQDAELFCSIKLTIPTATQ